MRVPISYASYASECIRTSILTIETRLQDGYHILVQRVKYYQSKSGVNPSIIVLVYPTELLECMQHNQMTGVVHQLVCQLFYLILQEWWMGLPIVLSDIAGVVGGSANCSI